MIITQSPKGPPRGVNTLINESPAINDCIIMGWPVMYIEIKIELLYCGLTQPLERGSFKKSFWGVRN